MLVDIVKGVVRGCREARCALVGGETAELPGLYAPGKWDLAGFCVGLVDEPDIIDGRTCRAGDVVIGLASSGLHSNGYSLARKVFAEREIKAGLWRELLQPTRIYCTAILRVLKKVRIKAMSHITGGGFYDNIPRVIPGGLGVRVEKGSWHVPPIFKKIQRAGRVDEREMYRTLNMGVGMALVVRAGDVDRAIAGFARLGFKAWPIGEIVRGRHEVVLF
jgi:phosphoribosylformylglycinamidine cyclo-ligase